MGVSQHFVGNSISCGRCVRYHSPQMAEHHERELLERIETYYDAMPRFAARTEDHGSLTLFVNQRPGWHYYARPRRGASEPIQAADVAAVRARQRELGIPEAFEWVAEV